MRSVIGIKQDLPIAERDEVAWHAAVRTRVDVRQETRAFCGAIARPKLETVSPILGPKQGMPSIEGKEIRWIAAAWTRINVIHQTCAFGSTVAGPQLNSVGPVLGIEQRPSVA